LFHAVAVLVEFPADGDGVERASHHQVQRLHRSNGGRAVRQACWQALAPAHTKRQGTL